MKLKRQRFPEPAIDEDVNSENETGVFHAIQMDLCFKNDPKMLRICV